MPTENGWNDETTSTPVGDQLREHAHSAVQQGQQIAGSLIDKAREQITTQLNTQKTTLSTGLGQSAQAIRLAADHVRENAPDQTLIADYAGRAATQVERLSTYAGQTDLEQITRDLEGVARRNPALFIGGTIVLGALAARFFKSTGKPDYNGASYGTRSDEYISGRGSSGTSYPGYSYAGGVSAASMGSSGTGVIEENWSPSAGTMGSGEGRLDNGS